MFGYTFSSPEEADQVDFDPFLVHFDFHFSGTNVQSSGNISGPHLVIAYLWTFCETSRSDTASARKVFVFYSAARVSSFPET